MRNQGPNVPSGKIISLTVCFSLLLILIFGSVFSSSSYNLLNNTFADDMMDDPTGTGSGGSGGSGGQGSGSGPESGDGADGGEGSSSGPESGDGGGSGNNNADENDDNNNNNNNNDNSNQGQKGSSGGPKAVEIGKCDPGFKYNDFGDCVSENPRNTGPGASVPNTCPVSYNPEESDLSSVWVIKKEQLMKMKINYGVFYFTTDYKGIQQQPSLFHQVQMQLGKTYDLSSYSGTECNINQVRNNDGSITATITFPHSPTKMVIRTDTTGKVPVQFNYLGRHDDKIYASEAIDNNGIKTLVHQDVSGGWGLFKGIETTEPGGARPIISVVLDSKDGSLKILSRGALAQSSVGPHELQDDNDGDPTVATAKNGMKATVKPFNVAYPNPGASKDDPLTTATSNHLVFDIINPDSSVKTHVIINPDGSVQPGSKWTEASVEPADESDESVFANPGEDDLAPDSTPTPTPDVP